MIHITQDKKICNEKTYIVVHFLIILFGISSWIGINGIFIQIPILINTSPEGWSLSIYLVSITQTANFGPLLYIILQYFKCKINESWWIMCLLMLGTLAMGFLSFFSSEKTVIANNEYSLLLFVLTFFNALVSCFSSILFMPYLRNFNIKFLTSYFIGEGLSGVLPSIIALIQRIGYISECTILKNNTNIEPLKSFVLKFSPNEYFLFIFIILFLSLVAFAILEYSSVFQNIKQIHNSISIVLNEKQAYSHDHCTNNIQEMKHYLVNNSKYLTKQIRNYLFILLAIFCFLSHGFFPSIQFYSCLPYGSIAYKLSIICAQIANPLMCLLAFWFKISSIKLYIINYLCIICLLIGSYVTYLAISPSPPLQATKLGIFLVIISWALLMGFVSYLKLIVISVFRNTMLPNILFNVGAIMQIASASGAIFSFIIINFTNYFEVYDNCT